MRQLKLSYPHDAVSLLPAHLRAAEIWSIAKEARSQLCRRPNRPTVDLGDLTARCRSLIVNDIEFEAIWEMDGPVVDEEGKAVLGVTEEASRDPKKIVTVRLNADLIGDRTDLARSTALHELGHVVFDVPGWLVGAKIEGVAEGADGQRLDLGDPNPPAVDSEAPIDWLEWRANEFMGAFLAPPELLHREVIKRAPSVGLRLIQGSYPLPIVDTDRFGPRFDDLAHLLGEAFGLSMAFVSVRLSKYGLLAG